MAGFAYTDLYNYIQAYTEYSEATFLTQIPFFVRLAEEDIYRRASLPLQSKVVTTTLTASSNTFTLPSDFLNMEYASVVGADGKYNMLLNKEADYIYQAWPDPTYKAMPQHYNQRDAYTIILGPTPDSSYGFIYQYVQAPTSLVDSGSTPTWLSTNAQNALLYGSLIQAYIYMKGSPELMADYLKLYEDAIKNAKMLGETLDRSDNFRNPMPRNIPEGKQ